MLLVYNKLTISPVLIPELQEATTEVTRNTRILEQFVGYGKTVSHFWTWNPDFIFFFWLDTPAEYIILR